MSDGIFDRPLGTSIGEAFGPPPVRVKRWQWRTILLDPIQCELDVPLNPWNIALNALIGILAAAVLLGAIVCLLLPG